MEFLIWKEGFYFWIEAPKLKRFINDISIIIISILSIAFIQCFFPYARLSQCMLMFILFTVNFVDNNGQQGMVTNLNR